MHACSVIASLFFLSAAFVAVRAEQPKFESPKKRELPRWFQCECYPGTIKAIDKNSITIAELAKPTKITTYPLHTALAAGGIVDNALDSNAYGVKEIKEGDIVRVFAFKDNDVEFCLSISILERAGGKVPPSRKPEKENPWHEVQNLKNYHRKMGTEMPQRIDPPIRNPEIIPLPVKKQ